MKHRNIASGNFEWYTPASWIDGARIVMGGIDLDPATSLIANQTVQADRIFTIEDDGLLEDWHGRVWLNPPYARRVIDRWVDKLIREYLSRRCTEYMALVNNCTETGWGQRLMEHSEAICFIKGRIRFEQPNGASDSKAPLQGQMLCYGGPNVQRFRQTFLLAGITTSR